MRLTTILFLITLCAFRSTAIAQDAIATYQKSRLFVFTVEATGSTGRVQGSAVAVFNAADIDPKANIYELAQKTITPSSTSFATNEHVVRGVSKVIVRQGTNSYAGAVEYRDASLDLALIKVDKAVFPTADIVPLSQIQVGQRVFAIGSPFGLESSISEGIVSGKRSISGVSVIQTTAAISPGNSGGGLFDANGKLLGITTFRLREGQNLNFAIESEILKHISKAMVARDLLKLHQQTSNAPQHILDLLDSRLVTWLATFSETDQQRRYEEVIEVFGKAIARSIDPEMAESRIKNVMQAYIATTSNSASGADRSPSPIGAAARTVLVCDLDLGPRGKQNPTFAVDFDRKLVNGKPAQFHDDRIVIGGEGGTRLEIDRYFGTVKGFSDDRHFARTLGVCKRAADKQF